MLVISGLNLLIEGSNWLKKDGANWLKEHTFWYAFEFKDYSDSVSHILEPKWLVCLNFCYSVLVNDGILYV